MHGDLWNRCVIFLGECFSSCIRLLLAEEQQQQTTSGISRLARRVCDAMTGGCGSRRRFCYSRNSNIFERIWKFVAIELSSMHPRHVYGIYVTCRSLVTFQRYIFYEWNITRLVFFLSWTHLGHGSAQSSLTRTLPMVSPVPWNGNTQLYSVVLRCSKQRRHISVVSFERTSAHVPAALDNWERSPNRSFVTIIPRIITADKWKITSRSFNLLLRCLPLSRLKILDKLFFHYYNTT